MRLARKNYFSRKRKSSTRVLIVLLFVFLVLIMAHILTEMPDRDINEVVEEMVGAGNKTHKYSLIVSENNEKVFYLEKGQIKDRKPLYYSIRNNDVMPLTPRLVINGRGWYTYELLMEEALRGINRGSDKEVVEALWKFVTLNSSHTKTSENIRHGRYQDPLKFLNIWGYGLCSDTSGVFARLSYEMGYPSRIVQLNKHMVAEVYYDSDWHMYDTDFNIIFKDDNGEVLSVKEIIEDKSILEQITSKLGWGERIYAIQKKVYSLDEPIRIQNTESLYDYGVTKEFAFSLRPQEEIRFYYDWPDRYFSGWVDERPDYFTNGLLITRVGEDNFTDDDREDSYKSLLLRDLLGETVLVDVSLPYPILGVYIVGDNACGGKVEVARGDDPDQWETPNTICKKGYREIKLDNLEGESALPAYKYSIEITNAKIPFYMVTQFQVSTHSLPVMRVGHNDIKSRNYIWGNVQVDVVVEE